MHRYLLALTTAQLLCTAWSTSSSADDWSNWRGPRHDGVSLEADWNNDWKSKPPRQAWKVNVGTGFSTVSVVGDRLYTMGNRAHGDANQPHDIVSCLNAKTGKVIWEHAYACKFVDGFHEGGPGATPTVDGDRLYTLSRRGHLFCLSAADGEVKWSKNLLDDLGIKLGEWGMTCSPLVLGEKLIIDAGRIVAYDKQSGKQLWQSKTYRHGYGSPVAFHKNGKAQLTVVNNDALVVADAASGTIVAEHPWETRFVTTSATPVMVDDKIFVSSGYNVGCALLQLNEGELEEVYFSRLMRNHFNNSVLYKGTLYGMDGNSHNARNVQVVAMNAATGRVQWSHRGYGCGSLTIAGDKLLVLSDDGTLALAEATTEKYTELASIEVLNGRCWTVPVLANGRIYCRNADGDLVCLDVSK